MRTRRPLFEAAGGDGNGKPPPAKDSGIDHAAIDKLTDVGEKVQMSRAEYDKQQKTIAELTAKASEASDLKTKVETLQTVADTVKKLYDPNQQNAEEARAAYVALLAHAGYSKDDAEKEADVAFPEGVDDEDPNRQGKPDPNTPPQPSAEQLVLKQVIDRDIHDAVAKELGRGDLAKILDFIAKAETVEEKGKPKVDGKKSERYKNMVEHLSSQTETALRTRLINLRDRLGVAAMQTSVLQWIRDESEKAGDEVAGKARLYVGDPSNLGRTPAGPPAGESPFDVLASDPLPVPQFKENPEPGTKTLDQDVGDYMADRLSRAAKEASAAGQV